MAAGCIKSLGSDYIFVEHTKSSVEFDRKVVVFVENRVVNVLQCLIKPLQPRDIFLLSPIPKFTTAPHTRHPPRPTPQILRPAAETNTPPSPAATTIISTACKSRDPQTAPPAPPTPANAALSLSPSPTPTHRPHTIAAMAPLPSAEPAEPIERLPMPSKNPLPLSAGQETQVRDLYFARVRALCAAEIKGSSPPFQWLFPIPSSAWLGPVVSCRAPLLTRCSPQNSPNAQSAAPSPPPSHAARNAWV
jgi:hypothetical protein